MKGVIVSFFDAFIASKPSKADAGRAASLVNINTNPDFAVDYNTNYAPNAQKMTDTWNSYYPTNVRYPLSNASTLAAAAGVIGGLLGIALAITIGAPVAVGAMTGLAVFGLSKKAIRRKCQDRTYKFIMFPIQRSP